MSRNKHSNDWKRELENEERLTPEEKRLAARDQQEREAIEADLQEIRREEEEKFDKKWEIEAEFDNGELP